MARSTPQNRGGYWYLVKRVPRAYASVDSRKFVRVSTGIAVADDPRGIAAAKMLPALETALIVEWEDRLAGKDGEHAERYRRALARAQRMGVRYVPAADLAEGPVSELVSRLERLGRDGSAKDALKVEAVLGGVAPPELHLSGLYEAYKETQGAYLSTLSPGQAAKWGHPKQRALADLISVIGDKPVLDLIRADALAFRKHWQERVIGEGLAIDTANKAFGHISKMITEVERERQLGIPPVFRELRLEGGGSGQRTAYSVDFVAKRFLAPEAFAGLNDEARDVILVMIETGLRPTEIVNLPPECIHLAADIPHIDVRPVGRRLKTAHSTRLMPLVGVALEAMRRHPQGFPRYRDKSATLSATVNKHLSEAGLRPTPLHSLYSLRHTFEDRLTAVNAPDKVIAVLMGHKHQRPKYGTGPSLALLQDWLSKIMLPFSEGL